MLGDVTSFFRVASIEGVRHDRNREHRPPGPGAPGRRRPCAPVHRRTDRGKPRAPPPPPPPAANGQPLRVLYVRPGPGRDRLVEHMADGNKAKTASAPAVAVLALDTRFHEHIPAVIPYKPELKDVFEANETMRTETGRFSAALQAGYFLLAVRAHGLAAGPMGGFDAAALDADFFPDGRWRSILVVNIGHPGQDPWFGRLPRLDHSDVVHWA